MTITQRLFSVFSLLSVSLVALVIVAVTVVTGFQSRFQFVQSHAVPSLISVGNMIEESNWLIILMYRHQSLSDPAKQTDIEKMINTQINDLRRKTQDYLENEISNENDKQLTETALEAIKQIDQTLPTFLNESRAQNDAVSLQYLLGNTGVGEVVRNLVDIYKKQLQLNVKIGEGLRNDNTRIYNFTLWGMIGGSILLILILGYFTVITIRRISQSLHTMRSTMEDASSRLDLSLRVEESGKDEVGMTAKAYNQLVGNVAASLLSVSKSSQAVSSASAQISAGNQDLSARTEEQAASLEQTAASMTELSETVRQTAEHTGMANKLAENANSLSEGSSDKVNTMLNTMSDIRSSAEKITDIISIIEGIAFQTNILALNAAVEAARAGEQGRGFAVVAGEVRTLAQRSSSSAREIKELIETSMHFVTKGAVQAEEVGNDMKSIKNAIGQVTELVSEIAAAAKEQTQGIDQVHQAVNQMDDVTQQNASLVEEASAASQSLMEQANVLNQLVNTFIIEVPSAEKLSTRSNPDNAKERLTPSSLLGKKKLTQQEDNWQSF